MSESIEEFVSFYQLPTGRTTFAFTSIAETLDRFPEDQRPAGFDAFVQRTLELSRDVEDLEARKRGAERSRARYSQRMPGLDSLLDRRLGGIADSLDADARTFGEDSERGQRALAVLRNMFPAGVREVTSLAFIEQHRRVGAILDRLRTPGSVLDEPEEGSILEPVETQSSGMADDVQALGLGAHVAAIVETFEAYGEALQEPRDSSFGAELGEKLIRTRRERHRSVLLYIAAVWAKFGSEQALDQRYRELLLGPLMQQRDDVRASRRGRRRVVDVDPGTGDPLVDDGGDATVTDPETA